MRLGSGVEKMLRDQRQEHELSGFGLRISFGSRISNFGFRDETMSRSLNTVASASDAVPPKLAAARPGFQLALAISVAAATGVGALLFLFNPAEHAFYPQCFFHQATGLHCPGCGGLRAVHQLLHGHLLAALHLNVLAVLSLPLFAGLLGREFAGRRRAIGAHPFVSAGLVWCFVGLLLVFTVLRNLTAFAFLAP